jgi:hypothetical protein
VLYSTVVPPRFGINEKGDEPLYVMHSGFGAVDGKKTLAKDRTRALPAIMSNVTFKKLMHYTTQKENKA